MVQYLQNNVIMKWTTRFTGWIPLKYGSTTTPLIIAHCKKNSDVKGRISHCDPLTSNISAPRVLTSSQTNFQNKSLLKDVPYIRDKTVANCYNIVALYVVWV